MSSNVHPSRPPSVLMLLAGSASPLQLCTMTLWLLLLAFGTMCTFAMVGAWTSLGALRQALARRTPRRMAAAQRPRQG